MQEFVNVWKLMYFSGAVIVNVKSNVSLILSERERQSEEKKRFVFVICNTNATFRSIFISSGIEFFVHFSFPQADEALVDYSQLNQHHTSTNRRNTNISITQQIDETYTDVPLILFFLFLLISICFRLIIYCFFLFNSN